YTLFSQFGIFNQTISQIAFTLFFVVAGLVFAWNFCKAIFSPDSQEWRLLNLPNNSARKMFWFSFALFAIYANDALFTTINSTLSGPLSLTVLQGVITAILIGSVLIAMAYFIHRRSDYFEQDAIHHKRFRWDNTIALALALYAIAIIIAALLGYIGLARFLAQQIVVTGAIVSIMYVGIIASRELSREGVLATTAFGRSMLQRGYEPYKVEQVALAAGLGLLSLVLLIGIPAIFMQWGTRFEEITALGHAAFTGFDIGGFRLSLSGVLIGALIFGIILLLTRLFQGWLSRSVFPRSNMDPGVSDSIKAGIGYVGFGVAALMAVTSAGLDLSSLAIVAGALSLGIGFGLQNIVSNFVSGLILLVERPIKVGDWITVGAAEGFVKKISVRATEIETFQRQSVIVPNSELINSQVNNWTHKTKNGRCDVVVGISYSSDARLAESILYEIAHDHAMVQKKPEPRVIFLDFGPSSLDFRLQMFLYDILNVAIVGTEVRFEILKRFGEAGIEIPFPQQDVHLKLSSDAQKEVSKRVVKKKIPKISTQPKTKRNTQPD
ncbi:MAG: mechanosensitive ion channel domain-containing protein, partial [Salaquimonas sp.]